MKLTWILALQASFFGFAAPGAFGQAIEETTALLTHPTARDQAIQGDAKAQAADAQVKSLGLSPQSQERVFHLTSKVFEKISADSGGDLEKMNDQIQGFMRDPSSLEKQLTPEQKSEIHDLSTEAKVR